MTFDREAWLPAARSVYDDDSRTYDLAPWQRRRREYEELPEYLQNEYIGRAMRLVQLSPEHTELVQARLDLSEVRAVLRDLPQQAAVDVLQALDGPARCRARSRGDSDARCAHPEGHEPITELREVGRTVWDHAAPGVWWIDR